MDEPVVALHPAAEYAKSLGLIYEADFIPWSKSRSWKDKAGFHDWSINWRIRLKRPGRVAGFMTDYTQGIAHLPKSVYVNGERVTNLVREAVWIGVEEGLAVDRKRGSFFHKKRLKGPAIESVMHSLTLDYDATEMPFEEWAFNFGYDPDSRKAEATYNECRAIASRLRSILDHAEIAKFRELLQDY